MCHTNKAIPVRLDVCNLPPIIALQHFHYLLKVGFLQWKSGFMQSISMKSKRIFSVNYSRKISNHM